MLGNYLAAALRNLARNRLHSAITAASLAIGFAAVIFAALYSAYEHGYDRFWPGANRLYLAAQRTERPNRDPRVSFETPAALASLLHGQAAGVEAVTRAGFGAPPSLSHGKTTGVEPQVMWVDANFFDLFPVSSVAGDASRALAAPDAIVLTESLARKYFGDDDVLGRPLTLTLRSERGAAPLPPVVLRVSAVIRDLPRNSHLQGTAFLTGPAALSPLAVQGAEVLTYARLRPGTDPAAFQRTLDDIVLRQLPASPAERRDLQAMSMRDVYMPPLSASAWMGEAGSGRPGIRRGSPTEPLGLYIISGLLLVIASINFITLMTARGARRAVEVGVRKAAGARRRDLVLQFIGEALVFALLALVLGLALVELLTPWAGKALERPIALGAADAGLLLRLFLGALGVGVLAGFYPALALSSFKPATVLKGGLAKTPGSARLRQVLIAVQFTPLILLAFSATAGDRQARGYAENSYRRLDPYTLIINEPCAPALRDRIAALPGVRLADCAFLQGRRGTPSGRAVNFDRPGGGAKLADGRVIEVSTAAFDLDDLELHGFKPVAGALWSDLGEPAVLLNATAVRDLGFDPEEAVGRPLEWHVFEEGWKISTIKGVVNDRGGFAGEEALIFFPWAADPLRQQIGVRLTGRDVPATLAAIDAIWADTGQTGTMRRSLWRDEIEGAVAANGQEVSVQNAVMSVGMLLATMGLFGLAAFLAEQRTKEVGVRKAMGADRKQLLGLLVLQFVKPVLIANVLAIGLNEVLRALFDRATSRAFRSSFIVWDYAPVVIGSVLIAVLATFLHAWRVSATRPVSALRYE